MGAQEEAARKASTRTEVQRHQVESAAVGPRIAWGAAGAAPWMLLAVAAAA
jgi:hypothetical protein